MVGRIRKVFVLVCLCICAGVPALAQEKKGEPEKKITKQETVALIDKCLDYNLKVYRAPLLSDIEENKNGELYGKLEKWKNKKFEEYSKSNKRKLDEINFKNIIIKCVEAIKKNI